MTGAVQGGRYRGGALMLIAALMIGSAIVRLAAQAGPALARETGTADAHGQTDAAHATQLAHDGPAHDPMSYDAGELLKALRARERALLQREQDIDDRLRALHIADSAITERMAALVDAEDQLCRTLALADGASERDLTQLTTVYEQMKPKETAALFEEMAPEFAAGFLARMRPEIAAGVMAGMTPKAAYTISVILAGRNMQVPTQ